MKFLKTSRVCLVTRGRYAGKKVRYHEYSPFSISRFFWAEKMDIGDYRIS